MAKQIEPVTIWVNGETKTAEFLDAYGIHLTLGTSETFFWSLSTKVVDDQGVAGPGQQIAQGNVDMTGDDYQQWQQDEFAWEWIAEQLNLVLLP
jgi:hypothetical protein